MFGKLLSLWTGNGSNGISTQNGGGDVMSAAINGNMPKLNGPGAMLSPGDTNYPGHFRDGDMILLAEQNQLEDYAMLAGLAEAEAQKSTIDLKLAKPFYKNVATASNNRRQIVQLHNKTKGLVTANHLAQFQGASGLKSAQMRIAGGYSVEKDRLSGDAERVQNKVEQFRSRLAERMSGSRRM